MAEAMFGAGCFWGIEHTFRQVPGVVDAAVGYSGGHTEHPTYQDVCGHRTGHTEVVHVDYDPEQVGYDRLLEVFWECHDPTQLNRQGPDIGDQYRSAIYFYTPEQEAAARASREHAQSRFPRPIVTEITPASTFWRGEEYHQQYFAKRGYPGCGIHG